MVAWDNGGPIPLSQQPSQPLISLLPKYFFSNLPNNTYISLMIHPKCELSHDTSPADIRLSFLN